MHYINKLYLASGSPRRRLLITQLFKNTEVLGYSCDEPKWRKGLNSKEYIQLCLDAKWGAALAALPSKAQKSGIGLLVADTIVVFGKVVLGKPESKAEAEAALKTLSGTKHEVWTGYRFGRCTSKSTFKYSQEIVKSRVQFRELSNKEIREYVKSGEPMDKAGSYGFQGIGMHLIQSISGSYTNIVGLPLKELKVRSKKLGFS